jgi:TatD DNase family protein
MIIDSHCHFDLMPNPEAYISNNEQQGNIIIGMTNSPANYEMGANHVRAFKYIRLALGFHPQLADKIRNQLPLFDKYIQTTSYIGEIGLDFSEKYKSSKNIQMDCAEFILSRLKDKNKIISVHSRMAESELFNLLAHYEIENVIFHWYTGKLSLISKIVDRGYYFSINERMTTTESGRKIIGLIPKDRLLTETDAPFNTVCSIKNTLNNIGICEETVYDNLQRLLARIKK